MAKSKEKKEPKIIEQRAAGEYVVAKNHGDLKKGKVIKLNPITAESFKQRGIIE